MNTKEKIAELTAFGFKEYSVSSYEKFDRNWQYCLRDELGKKLFVQVRLWSFTKYNNHATDSFDAWCQFDMNGPKTFNVEMSVNDMTPAQIIEWFERMFDALNCTYYEYYDDDIDSPSNSCVSCGRWLGYAEDGSLPSTNLCECCSYEKETGFRKC